MAKKKQEVKQGLAEWMATYSDMVTLLMCFFVLLYASSTPDETKFQYIFQSFNSQGQYVNPFVFEEVDDGDSKTDNDGNSSIPAGAGTGTQIDEGESGIGLPNNFDELFAWVSKAAASSEHSEAISVYQTSSGRINIRLNNSIMFAGDSAVLLESGKQALRDIMPGIKAVKEYIKNVRVQGHTAAGLSAVNDWDLSSARACSVVKYLDYNVVVESEKFVTEGRGPYDPIADNSTEEGRSENRRVEIVIIRNEKAISDTAILQDILQYDYGIIQAQTDPQDRNDPSGGTSPDSIQQIIDSLDDKYQSHGVTGEQGEIDYTGPVLETPIYEIPESILREVTEEAAEGEAEG